MIRIANAPCSWGVLEFALEGESVGYTQVLDEMHQTGYAGTELGDWGLMPTDPTELEIQLKARDLELVGAFVPVDFSNPEAHSAGVDTALRTARLLAVVGEAPFIILADENGKNTIRTRNAGRIKPEYSLSTEAWKTFAAGVTQVARAVVEQTGLRCVFHHHCAGFVETPAEIETLLELTDPDLVGLCFDTGHYAFGGGEVIKGYRELHQRIWHVHFKDHDPQIATVARPHDWDYFESVQHGIFCELGKGDVDFPALLKELEHSSYVGWVVVEQDVLPGMGSPKESAARNRAYLHGLGL